MTFKRILGVVLALLVVVGLVAVRAQRASERAHAPRLTARPVTIEVAEVRSGSVESRETFLGEAIARDEAPLAARITSQVVVVAVREGDAVRRGQVLVELDRRELDDAAASSEAAIAAVREARLSAQVSFDAQRQSTARDAVLFQAEAISRDEWERSHAAEAAAHARLEAAQAQVATAAKALESADTRRSYATIRAPFDAVVSACSVTAGDLATPGKPLVTVVGMTGVRIRVKLPAERALTLSRESRMAMQGPAGELVVPIARVFPAMDAAHLATVEVDPPPALRLLPGSTIRVDALRQGANGLVVPRSALLENQAGAYLFVLAGDRVRPVLVQVVDRGTDAVTVRGEVRAGDRVATGTPSRLLMLTADTRVEVATRATGSVGQN
jgi:RND family efflux transporter MFP subunit